MVGAAVPLPLRGDEVEAGEGISLRDQIIAAMAIVDDGLSGAGIAGIHDHPRRCFDPIPESLLPLAVLYQERFHGDVAVLVDVAGFDLMHVHPVASWVRPFQTGGANSDVLVIGGEN